MLWAVIVKNCHDCIDLQTAPRWIKRRWPQVHPLNRRHSEWMFSQEMAEQQQRQKRQRKALNARFILYPNAGLLSLVSRAKKRVTTLLWQQWYWRLSKQCTIKWFKKQCRKHVWLVHLIGGRGEKGKCSGSRSCWNQNDDSGKYSPKWKTTTIALRRTHRSWKMLWV